MPRTPQQIADIQRKIAQISSWYHRIDLGDGIQTPGHFRMADYVAHYHLPERMDGMRVLDVGASTGFFAYEFERRGAAEVVGVELPSWDDHDWTPRQRREFAQMSAGDRHNIDREVMRDGFTVVGEALGRKRVRRVFKAIYELRSRELGTFDVQHLMGHADSRTTARYTHYKSRADEAKKLAAAFRVAPSARSRAKAGH